MKIPKHISSIMQMQQNLIEEYKRLGASNHQIARNPYPMHKLIQAAFLLVNPKHLQFPDYGMTLREIQAEITKMGWRSTLAQLGMEIHKLKLQKQISGGYCDGSKNVYVWSLCN